MLRGDLETTPLADLLQRLSDAKATGCVYVLPAGTLPDSGETSIALRDGAICSVTVPGTEDAVALRLVASRRLSPAALDEAREAQENDLSSWLLSELLVHLGLAEESLVQEFTVEQALSDLEQLCGLRAGSWRFRRRERWRPTLADPLPVEQILQTVQSRQTEWRELLPTISGADAVVSLAARPDVEDSGAQEAAQLELDADSYALLCAVDGVRTVAELGQAAGLTQLDGSRTIARLVTAGLVSVTPSADDSEDLAADDLAGVALSSVDSLPVDGDGGAPPLDAIAAALSFSVDGPLLPADVGRGFSPVGPAWQPPRPSAGDPLASALARVSAALSDAMGGPKETDEVAATEADVAGAEPEAVVVDPPAEPIAAAETAAIAEVVPLRPLAATDVVPEVVEDVPPVDVPEDEILVGELPADEIPADEVPAEEILADAAGVDAVPEAEVLATPEAVAEPEIVAEPEVVPEPTIVPEPESLPEPADVIEPSPPVPPFEYQEAASLTVAAEAALPAALPMIPPQPYPQLPPPPQPQLPLPATAASAADASRLLSQLAGEPPVPPAVEPVEEPTPPAPLPLSEPEPRPRREDGLADTAALLRELSSLGAENDAPASRPAATRHHSAATAQQARKRKGLFGRN